VLDGSGKVVATIPWANQDAGRHNFAWPDASKPPTDSGLHLPRRRHLRQAGGGRPARWLDRVQSVSTAGDALTLNLARSGSVPASAVVAFN
jgi:hypothetical protein